MLKKCIKCHKDLNINQFRYQFKKLVNGSVQKYYYGACKKCTAIYILNYQRSNKDWARKMSKKGYYISVYRRVGKKCLICGEYRVIDVCHIIPRNGKKRKRIDKLVIGLCPTHHRLFDKDLLTDNEFLKIKNIIIKLKKKYE